MRLLILVSLILCSCSSNSGHGSSKILESQKITTKTERKNEAFKTGRLGPGTAQIGDQPNPPQSNRPFPW